MAAILRIEKSRYLESRLGDFDKILHDNISPPKLTICSIKADRPLTRDTLNAP